MCLGDLAQALAMLPVSLDSLSVQFQRMASDGRPSSLARRMPARTRSTIRLRSSSAMAPMMTTMARPSGPPVSIVLRKLMNSMFSRFSSSSTSRKCRTERAIRSDAQTRTTSNWPRRASAHHLIESRPLGLSAGDPVGILVHDLIATLSSHLPQIEQLRLRMLIDGRYPHIESGALHARLLFFFGAAVFADVVLDELEQHDCHFEALGCGCGLKSVVKVDRNVQVHTFCSFWLSLDLTHLLSSEMSL